MYNFYSNVKNSHFTEMAYILIIIIIIIGLIIIIIIIYTLNSVSLLI